MVRYISPSQCSPPECQTKLHWLPFKYYIYVKQALVTRKVLHSSDLTIRLLFSVHKSLRVFAAHLASPISSLLGLFAPPSGTQNLRRLSMTSHKVRNSLSQTIYSILLLEGESPWPGCLRRWLGSLVYVSVRGPSSRPSHGAHWHGPTQPTA